MSKDHSFWLIGSLQQHEKVARVVRLARDVIQIDRKEAPPAIVGVISTKRVEITDYTQLLSTEPRTQFILSIPNVALWTGRAINDLEFKGVAWGKMYDLYRALNNEANVSFYRNPSLTFIERLFNQHNNIVRVERLFDHVFRLHRKTGDSIVVALTDAYEVTADAVRTAYDTLAPFDVLLKNTPYGRVSQLGREVADQLGVEICDQSSIFGRLAS
ncbi:MAG: hypothetical protein INF97_11955 [Roseomonas sp.]|nr:hypothetical protein [Roseomonas sp.]